jgi:hypothetical protein
MISTIFRIYGSCALAALSIGLFATAAKAGVIDASKVPVIVVSAGENSGGHLFVPDPSNFSASGTDGDYSLTSSMNLGGISSASVSVQQLEFNNDPFVLNNFLVTNNLAVPQVFSVFVGLPAGLAAPNTISGNVRTSVIDGGTDGATITSVAGSAIYQAQVDFAAVQTLQNDPFSVVAVPGGSNTASATFGPTLSNVPVNATIGVQLRFMLSGGDTASILSRFDVIPGGPNGGLPEPTTLTLGGIVMVLGVGLRGRRGR